MENGLGKGGCFSSQLTIESAGASLDPLVWSGLESRPKHISVLSKHQRMPLFEMF